MNSVYIVLNKDNNQPLIAFQRYTDAKEVAARLYGNNGAANYIVHVSVVANDEPESEE